MKAKQKLPTKKNAGSGRPGKRVFDSMAQAAAVLRISKATLAAAKSAGCPAFAGARVREAELLEWIEDHDGELGIDKKDSLQCDLLGWRIKTAALDHRERQGELVPWAEVREWMAGTLQKFRASFIHQLRDELPARLEGLRAPQIAKEFERIMPALFDEFRNLNGRKIETE